MPKNVSLIPQSHGPGSWRDTPPELQKVYSKLYKGEEKKPLEQEPESTSQDPEQELEAVAG